MEEIRWEELTVRNGMDEVDPELIKTFNKLGIPLEEQMALSGMAVDAVRCV